MRIWPVVCNKDNSFKVDVEVKSHEEADGYVLMLRKEELWSGQKKRRHILWFAYPDGKMMAGGLAHIVDDYWNSRNDLLGYKFNHEMLTRQAKPPWKTVNDDPIHTRYEVANIKSSIPPTASNFRKAVAYQVELVGYSGEYRIEAEDMQCDELLNDFWNSTLSINNKR